MLEQLKQSARDAQAQVKAAEVVQKTELEQLKARVAKLEQDKIELTEKMATYAPPPPPSPISVATSPTLVAHLFARPTPRQVPRGERLQERHDRPAQGADWHVAPAQHHLGPVSSTAAQREADTRRTRQRQTGQRGGRPAPKLPDTTSGRAAHAQTTACKMADRHI